MLKPSRQTRRAPSPPARDDAPARPSPLALAGILLGALLLRLLALHEITTSVYGGFLLWDERVYHEWARQIAAGSAGGAAVYEFPPLPAYLTALLYRLAAPDVFLVRLLNVGLGTLTCGLVYLIGRRLGSPRVGLVAALLAALYKPLILYSVVPLKEALAVALFAAVTALFLALWDSTGAASRRAWLQTGLLGVAGGLLFNVRPNALLMLPVLPLALVLRGWRNRVSPRHLLLTGLLFALGFAAVVAPFVIRNYRVAGTLQLTTSQMGFNLYLGNNPGNPTPYYRPAPFAVPSPFLQGVEFSIEAGRRAGRALSAEEASAFWTHEVLARAAEAPAAFARKAGQKLLALVNGNEVCDHYHLPFLGQFVPVFAAPFPTFWIVLPLGLAGLLVGPIPRGTRWVLLATAGLYAVTLVGFFLNGRYRIPLVVLLIPGAAVTLDHLWSRLRTGWTPEATRLAAVAAVAGLLPWIPVEGADDVTAAYNTHAIVLDAQGRQAEAIRYWTRSSDMGGAFSDFANLSLARKAYAGGRFEAGDVYLGRIRDDSFSAAPKYDLLGDGWLRRNRLAEAAAAYARSLTINTGQRWTRQKLIRVSRLIDPPRAAREEEQARALEPFYRGLPTGP